MIPVAIRREPTILSSAHSAMLSASLHVRALLVDHTTPTNTTSSRIVYAQKRTILRWHITSSTNPIMSFFGPPSEIFVQHVSLLVRIMLDEAVPCQVRRILARGTLR